MSRQDFFALRLAFIAELELVQARICASRCQQLAMSSALHDTAAVEHENLRRMLDRGETMGDDEAVPSLEQAIDRFLTDPLRFVIERGGSPTEEKNRGSMRSARAIAMRCRCPPDRRAPRSPSSV